MRGRRKGSDRWLGRRQETSREAWQRARRTTRRRPPRRAAAGPSNGPRTILDGRHERTPRPPFVPRRRRLVDTGSAAGCCIERGVCIPMLRPACGAFAKMGVERKSAAVLRDIYRTHDAAASSTMPGRNVQENARQNTDQMKDGSGSSSWGRSPARRRASIHAGCSVVDSSGEKWNRERRPIMLRPVRTRHPAWGKP